MKKFEVSLTAQMTGFFELVIEAENEEEAKQQALNDVAKIHVHDWDVQYVNYYGERGQYKEIEVNDIREVADV